MLPSSTIRNPSFEVALINLPRPLYDIFLATWVLTITFAFTHTRVAETRYTPNDFSDMTGFLNVDLSNNNITSVATGAFSGFRANYFNVNLANNSVWALPNGTFSGFASGHIHVDLSNNSIAVLGTLFDDFTSSASCAISMTNNKVGSSSLKVR
jgi:hypothetical protein